MARTLELAVGGLYERAEKIRDQMREEMSDARRKELGAGTEEREAEARKRRTRMVVKDVLDTPGRVGRLVEQGRMEEARAMWEEKLRLLERWRERGVGGEDVRRCINEGEAAIRGEPKS